MYRGITFRQFLVDLNREISEDNVFVGAAALGYYLTLAIFPALILLMTIIPYLPVANIDQEIMSVLETALPEDAFSMVSRVVEEVTSQRRGGLLSFGVLGTLWAASTGMYAIMQQLNITYDVSEARSYIRARAVALALSIMFGLLVIGAFWLIVAGGAAEDWLGEQRGIPDFLLTIFAVFRWIVIVLALLLGFALIYKFAPNVEQKFRFITPGSVIGVLLLIIASLGFAIYVANFADYSATYGSIGAIIVLLMYFYLSAAVLLFGAELNAVIEHQDPSGKDPGKKVAE